MHLNLYSDARRVRRRHESRRKNHSSSGDFSKAVLISLASAAVYPREASGGTWIACNSSGNLLALLNWNDVRPQVGGTKLRSRGLLIPKMISAEDLADTHDRFAQLRLERNLPFRLSAASFKNRSSSEWRWDGVAKGGTRHSLGGNVIGFLRACPMRRQQRERGRTCEEAETGPIDGIGFLGPKSAPIPRTGARRLLGLRSPQRRGHGELHRGALQRGGHFDGISQREPLPYRFISIPRHPWRLAATRNLNPINKKLPAHPQFETFRAGHALTS